MKSHGHQIHIQEAGRQGCRQKEVSCFNYCGARNPWAPHFNFLMTTQNPEDTPPIDPPAAPQGLDNRRRLRELLSVPERDRSDEQWDEIIELEIQLAPGNRISGTEHGSGSPGPSQGKPSGPGQQQRKHRPRTNNNNNNRRPRANKPPGNPT